MLTVSFKFDEGKALADRLERTARGGGMRAAAVRAVNAVMLRAEKTAIEGATAGINLSAIYVKSKTDTVLATRDPRAELVTRGDLVVMGRFPITQMTAAAAGRSRGDPSRGIAPGQRASGLSVAIKKVAPSFSAGWFTMPLRKGTERGSLLGVFYRPKGGGKPQHRYAVAPYSLMRYQHATNEPDVQADLSETGTTALRNVLQEGLQ